METLEILILLITASVLLVEVAKKFKIPYPVVLICAGALMSFIPGTQKIYFDPNIILLPVLPPILYYTALLKIMNLCYCSALVDIEITRISRGEMINLETAVQDDKVMQDFESELFLMGGDHSQKVKAPPIRSYYGSKIASICRLQLPFLGLSFSLKNFSVCMKYPPRV